MAKTPKGCVREGNFLHCRKESPSKFDKRSLRTVKRGKNRIIIGCIKGKWDNTKKRCKVGTRALTILKPV